jgi:hypothetical protein
MTKIGAWRARALAIGLGASMSGCAAEAVKLEDSSGENEADDENDGLETQQLGLVGETRGPIWISVLGPPLKPALPKVLDIQRGSLESGGAALLWDLKRSDDTANQRWFVEQIGERVVVLRNQKSGLCLDKSQSYGTGNGVPVYQYYCHRGYNQQWYFEHIGDSRNDWGMLINLEDGRCLDVSGANYTNGAGLIVWDCHGGWNQRWNIF